MEPEELAAIWLGSGAVQTSAGKTCRIATGHEVAYDGKFFVDIVVKPTHRVIGCYQTGINKYDFLLLNIETLEPIILSLC